MTVREYIERRRKIAMALLVPSMIAIMICAAMYPSYLNGSGVCVVPWTSIFATMGVIGLIHWAPSAHDATRLFNGSASRSDRSRLTAHRIWPFAPIWSLKGRARTAPKVHAIRVHRRDRPSLTGLMAVNRSPRGAHYAYCPKFARFSLMALPVTCRRT
jgi:hypothetical protein